MAKYSIPMYTSQLLLTGVQDFMESQSTSDLRIFSIQKPILDVKRSKRLLVQALQSVIDANFMTLELYYNTELGAVIFRNKDTRCMAICIAIRVSHIAIRVLAYCCTPIKNMMI